MITGGTEALIHDFAIAGFCAMRALPTNYNDHPEAASRPFDAQREGFVFSEGAAALVLESLEHALARGAQIYAEVVGQASSSDAFHIAAPDPDAKGPIRAMRWALEDAGLRPEQVDYINAHGSSTPLNDASRNQSHQTGFWRACLPPGDQLYQVDAGACHGRLRFFGSHRLHPGHRTWLAAAYHQL